MAGAAVLGFMGQSCSVDEPFDRDGEGELCMKLVVNSDVTRAEQSPEDLSSNCVVYISGAKGLLHKYQGIENVPERINLKNGHYVAEAWTGDSVSASFDSKFYRGYQPFDINGGLENVVLKCRIANVVVSVNSNTVDAELMKDWKVNVAHSRASLDFDAENMTYAKGYFMMPNADKDLTVTVTGKNAAGADFTKTQVIPNVERAHEYMLNFSYNPDASDPTDGGAFLTITVDDSEVLVEDEVEIYGRPAVNGVEFDINKQIIANAGAFTDKYIKVNAFGSVEHLYLSSDDYVALNLPSDDIDLPLATDAVKEQIKNSGILWEETYKEDRNLVSAYLTLSAAWLNNIAERDTEYVLNLNVVDKYGKSTAVAIRLAVGEGAIVIDDPVTADPVPDKSADQLAVRATRATLSGSIVNADAVNPGIRYREAGTSEWSTVLASEAARGKARRAHMSKMQALRSGGTSFSVVLNGLKPGTRYEYQAVAEGFNSESQYFTTEGKFIFPNASMEDWSGYTGNSKIVMPSADGTSTFWDSGNHGSVIASVTLTQGSTDMFHSGAKSCKMRSQKATVFGIGKFAAGNMFTGTFTLDGTDGILGLGRDFNGSHPDKLGVWVNYRPGTVQEVKNAGKHPLVKGDTDHGQIYVALTNEKIEVKTKNQAKLFDPADPAILAYGQVSWEAVNFGPDGALERVEIPLEYRAAAKTSKPLYVIVVCTASKYGDFFTGGEGSTLYADDFEFVYE